MSSVILNQYETCDSITKSLLQFSPIWSKSSGERYFKVILQYYGSIFGVVGGCTLLNKAFHSSDMDLMTSYLIPAIALTMNPFKLMPTVWCRKTFSEIYDQQNELLRQYCNSEIVIAIDKTTLNIFSLTMKFLSLSYKLMMINYLIVPIAYVIYQIIFNKQPVILISPISGYYYGNTTSSALLFGAHFMYEGAFIMIGGSTSLGADCLFGLIIFQMISILSAISNGVCMTGHHTDYIDSFHECVNKHCKLIEFSRKIQPIYGQMMLSQRVTDGIVLCATIFQMHKVVGSDMGKFGTYCSWVMLKFIQQLAYGWYGSLLISEGEKFKDTIYFSQWPHFYNKRIMKYIVHVLQQKPIQIGAFGFFIISIPMASSVIYSNSLIFCSEIVQ